MWMIYSLISCLPFAWLHELATVCKAWCWWQAPHDNAVHAYSVCLQVAVVQTECIAACETTMGRQLMCTCVLLLLCAGCIAHLLCIMDEWWCISCTGLLWWNHQHSWQEWCWENQDWCSQLPSLDDSLESNGEHQCPWVRAACWVGPWCAAA